VNVVVVGAGPAGLAFALALKGLDSSCDVRVLERGRVDDSQGFGLALRGNAAQLLDRLHVCAPMAKVPSLRAFFGGRTFCEMALDGSGVSRTMLVSSLAETCVAAGVHIETHDVRSEDLDAFRADLIVGADGVNSIVRTRDAATFQPEWSLGRHRYLWLAVRRPFENLELRLVEDNGHLWTIWAYPHEPPWSTLILECDEEASHTCPFDTGNESSLRAWLNGVLGEVLGTLESDDLRPGPGWQTFRFLSNAVWSIPDRGLVLLGDALHTSHYSVGLGTTLALEDGVTLAIQLLDSGLKVERALERFATTRRARVVDVQERSRGSMRWFETIHALYRKGDHVGIRASLEWRFAQGLP
jgi:anthraniloyl-CoA monooxygenase